MGRNGHLRASDADRDQVAERLRTAATEGRIATDELDERLGATLAARTYAELDAVIADLPAAHPERRRSTTPARSVARLAIAVAIVVPVLMAAIFLLTSVVAVWMVWAVVGWWFFGHRHHRHHHRYAGPHQAGRQARAGSGRGFWV
jgi:hypothetical protein